MLNYQPRLALWQKRKPNTYVNFFKKRTCRKGMICLKEMIILIISLMIWLVLGLLLIFLRQKHILGFQTVRRMAVSTFALMGGIPGCAVVGWPFAVGMTIGFSAYIYWLCWAYEKMETRKEQKRIETKSSL